MRTENTNHTYGSASNGKGLHVRPEDAHKLSGLLINTYSRATTPVREIIVNALEVQPEGIPVKVEIDYNSYANSLLSDEGSIDSSVITVTDRGQGMDKDFMETYLCGLTASTKDGDDAAVGGFGIGSKSVMSISDFTTWRSVKDGVATTLIMSKGDNGEIETHFATADAPDEKNGTVVKINVNPENVAPIVDNIGSDFLDYVDPDSISFYVRGSRQSVGNRVYSDMNVGDFIIGEQHGWRYTNNITILSDGNVPYEYSKDCDDIVSAVYSRVSDHFGSTLSNVFAHRSRFHFIVRMSLPRDRFIPNREALIESERMTRDIVKTLSDSIIEKIENASEKMKDADDFSEWIDHADSISKIIPGSLTRTLTVQNYRASGSFSEGFSGFRDFALDRLGNLSGKTVVVVADRSYSGSSYVFYRDSIFGKSIHRNKFVANYSMSNISKFFDYISDSQSISNFMKIAANFLPDYVGDYETDEEGFAALIKGKVVTPTEVREGVKEDAKKSSPAAASSKSRRGAHMFYGESNNYEGETISNLADFFRGAIEGKGAKFGKIAILSGRDKIDRFKELGLPYIYTNNPVTVKASATRVGFDGITDFYHAIQESFSGMVSEDYPEFGDFSPRNIMEYCEVLIDFAEGDGKGMFEQRSTVTLEEVKNLAKECERYGFHSNVGYFRPSRVYTLRRFGIVKSDSVVRMIDMFDLPGTLRQQIENAETAANVLGIKDEDEDE